MKIKYIDEIYMNYINKMFRGLETFVLNRVKNISSLVKTSLKTLKASSKYYVIIDNYNNLYLFTNMNEKPKFLVDNVTLVSVYGRKIAIIKNKSLYTYGHAEISGELGTTFAKHESFIKIDDDVVAAAMEHGYLRFKKTDGRVYYTGSYHTSNISLPNTNKPVEFIPTDILEWPEPVKCIVSDVYLDDTNNYQFKLAKGTLRIVLFNNNDQKVMRLAPIMSNVKSVYYTKIS